MGAWSSGSFDNDDARDWIEVLSGAQDFEPLYEAFDRTKASDYLEMPDCCAAVAAAEVVAFLRCGAALGMPVIVAEYSDRLSLPVPDGLVDSALEALQRVRSQSELQELWAESEWREEWYEAISDLESRLRSSWSGHRTD